MVLRTNAGEERKVGKLVTFTFTFGLLRGGAGEIRFMLVLMLVLVLVASPFPFFYLLYFLKFFGSSTTYGTRREVRPGFTGGRMGGWVNVCTDFEP